MYSFYLTCLLEFFISRFMERKEILQSRYNMVIMGLTRDYFTPKVYLDYLIDKIGYFISTGFLGWQKGVFNNPLALQKNLGGIHYSVSQPIKIT